MLILPIPTFWKPKSNWLILIMFAVGVPEIIKRICVPFLFPRGIQPVAFNLCMHSECQKQKVQDKNDPVVAFFGIYN